MPDWPTALISGAFAFSGGAASSWLKFYFDRASYNHDNNLRKTESAVRHLRSMADQVPAARDHGLDSEVAGYSFRKRIDTVNSECDALGMARNRRLRDEAEKIQAKLRDPIFLNLRRIDDATALEVQRDLLALSQGLQQTWREQAKRKDKTGSASN